MAAVLRKYEIPITGVLGAGTGAAAGEFVSETIARASGQTGWRRFGIKAALKAGLGVVFYGISSRLSGMPSLFMEIAGYGSAGSIIADLIYQIYPGGLWGLAESAAVSLRTAVMGAPRIRAEIERLEEKTERETAPEAVVV